MTTEKELSILAKLRIGLALFMLVQLAYMAMIQFGVRGVKIVNRKSIWGELSIVFSILYIMSIWKQKKAGTLPETTIPAERTAVVILFFINLMIGWIIYFIMIEKL